MELNLEVVGKVYEGVPFKYNWKTCATYALGIGASADDLEYTWEGAPQFKVVPSFAVCPTFPIIIEALQEIRADFRKLVHGAQTLTFHRAIPKKGILRSTGQITEVQDKGKGAVVIIETQTTDDGGQPLFDTSWSIFCRGQGDFGGERGESPSIPSPVSGADPVLDLTMDTRPEQALLYRLSGDLNPLHVDPELATKAGFEKPILHGLCTYGYAVHAVVKNLCGGDPARLKSFQARFSREVYPGDTLSMQVIPAEGSTEEKRIYRLQVDVGERTVLANGVVEVS